METPTNFLDGITLDDPPTTPKPRPRRERPKRDPHVKRSAPPKPPVKVEPGWIHDAIAAVILKALSDRKIDVGTVTDDFLRAVPGTEDAPEPAVLLSRVIAHTAHRIPGIRRIERRLEGRELRAGFGSDLLALAVQLYFRNRDLIAVAAKAAREAREQPKPTTNPEGGNP